jgi:hypothetical protein
LNISGKDGMDCKATAEKKMGIASILKLGSYYPRET